MRNKRTTLLRLTTYPTHQMAVAKVKITSIPAYECLCSADGSGSALVHASLIKYHMDNSVFKHLEPGRVVMAKKPCLNSKECMWPHYYVYDGERLIPLVSWDHDEPRPGIPLQLAFHTAWVENVRNILTEYKFDDDEDIPKLVHDFSTLTIPPCLVPHMPQKGSPVVQFRGEIFIPILLSDIPTASFTNTSGLVWMLGSTLCTTDRVLANYFTLRTHGFDTAMFFIHEGWEGAPTAVLSCP